MKSNLGPEGRRCPYCGFEDWIRRGAADDGCETVLGFLCARCGLFWAECLAEEVGVMGRLDEIEAQYKELMTVSVYVSGPGTKEMIEIVQDIPALLRVARAAEQYCTSPQPDSRALAELMDALQALDRKERR